MRRVAVLAFAVERGHEYEAHLEGATDSTTNQIETALGAGNDEIRLLWRKKSNLSLRGRYR